MNGGQIRQQPQRSTIVGDILRIGRCPDKTVGKSGSNPSAIVGYISTFTVCPLGRFLRVYRCGVNFAVYGFPYFLRGARGAAGMGLGRGGFSAAPSQGAFFAYFLGKYESEPPKA